MSLYDQYLEEQKKKKESTGSLYEKYQAERKNPSQVAADEQKTKQDNGPSLFNRFTDTIKKVFTKKKDEEQPPLTTPEVPTLSGDLGIKLDEVGNVSPSLFDSIDVMPEKVRADWSLKPQLFGSALESIKQSTISTIGSFGATAEMAGKMTGFLELTETGKLIQEKAQKTLMDNPEWEPDDPKQGWGSDKVVRLVSGAVPSLLGAFAATLAGGVPGVITYGFAAESGSAYKDAKDAGASEKKATVSALTVGTINGLLESVFPGGKVGKKVLKETGKEISESIIKQYLKNAAKFGVTIAKDGTVEGTTEAMQELTANVVANSYDKNRSAWDNLLEAFVGGFGSGAVTGKAFERKEVPSNVLTPDQALSQVENSNLKGTPAGAKITEVIAQAQESGKNIQFNVVGSGEVSVVTPGGTKLGMDVVDTKVPEYVVTSEEGTPAPATTNPAEISNKSVPALKNAIDNYKSDQGVTIMPDKTVEVSPALKELSLLAERPEVAELTQTQVKALPKNEDGTITLYRAGTVREGETRLVSAAYTKEAAVAFNEMQKKDMGDRPITEIKVKPEDIKVFIGGEEQEVLIKSPEKSVEPSSVEGGGKKFGTFKEVDLTKPVEQQYISKFADSFETTKNPARGLTYSTLDKMGSLDTALRQKGFRGIDKGKDFKGIYSLDKILDDPALFAKYPQLKETNVIFADFHTPTQKGIHIGNDIYINSKLYTKDKTALRSTIVHEIQHAKQEIKGDLPKFSQFEEGRGMTRQEYETAPREVDARRKQQMYLDSLSPSQVGGKVGGEVYYRGVEKGKSGTELNLDPSATYGKGVYMSDNPKIASEYNQNVVELKPNKKLNLYTPTEQERADIIDLSGKEQESYIKKLLGNKYDGLKIPERAGDGNEIVVYDQSLFSTSPQTAKEASPSNSQKIINPTKGENGVLKISAQDFVHNLEVLYPDTIPMWHNTSLETAQKIIDSGEFFADEAGAGNFTIDEQIDRVGGNAWVVVNVPKSAYDRIFPHTKTAEEVMSLLPDEMTTEESMPYQYASMLTNGSPKGSDADIMVDEIKPEWISKKVLKKTPPPKIDRTKLQGKDLSKPNSVLEKEANLLAITEANVKLREYYLKAGQDNPEALGQAWYEVMAELEVAEPGQRLFTEDGEFNGAISSTFPDFVPEELRNTKLFNSVLEGIKDPTNMTYPPASQPRKQALYDAILGEIDGRAELDSSGIINEIRSLYEKEAKPETAARGSAPGSQGPATPAKEVSKPPAKPEVPISRLQERIQEQLLEIDPSRYEFEEGTGTYNKLNLEDDAQKATYFLQNSPKEALGIALGYDDAPVGQTANGISLAVAFKARAEGNMELWKDIIVRTSLRNTKFGQEIVSLRGHFNNDTPENYIKKVLDARMDLLGKNMITEAQKIVGKNKRSAKVNAIEKIDRETDKLVEKVNEPIKKKKVADRIKMAQDIIDSLICK